MFEVTTQLAKRFWSRVDKLPGNGPKGDCWEWTAGKTGSGYGCFHDGPKTHGAHRWSYEFHKGKIPPGQFVCHTCDNPSCVNPEHLWVGTPKDNMTDKVNKNRQSKIKGERHWNSKLSKDDIIFIRRVYVRKHPLYGAVSLSQKLGVNERTIRDVASRRRWKHVGENTTQQKANQLTEV